MPDKNKKILITRPIEDAEATAEILEEKGYKAFIEPQLEIKFDKKAQNKIREALKAKPQAIIITSSNGIRAFANFSKIRDIEIVTIGKSSAREAKELGFYDVSYSPGAGVEELADYIKHSFDKHSGELLHIAGSILAGDLKGILKDAGFKVKRVTLYDAVPSEEISDKLKNAFNKKQISTVLFYSKRTAEIFMKNAKKKGIYDRLSDVKAISLSQNISTAVTHGPWKEALVSEFPDNESLLSLLDRT